MDFTFDDEQLALQDVARAALERECDPQMVRTLVDEPTAMTPALWSTLVELGWTGLLVPTEFGGAGTGLLEMTIVAEQMGRLDLVPAGRPQRGDDQRALDLAQDPVV